MLLLEDKVSKMFNTMKNNTNRLYSNIGKNFSIDEDWHVSYGNFADTVCIEEECHFATGASKLVFIKDSLSVVFKMPLDGEYTDCNFTDDEYFESFECAWSEYGNDYCEAEVREYEKVKDLGLEMFFTETSYYNTIGGHPVYLSEKAITFDDYYSLNENLCSEDSLNKARSKACSLPNKWLGAAIDFYGEEKVDELIDFIDNDDIIGDLHHGNIGFRANGEPIILDYSNFDS